MTISDFTLRSISAGDTDAVALLFSKEFGYNPDTYLLEYVLGNFPSIMPFSGEELVGFAYTRCMSYDVLKVLRISITPELRSQGLGTEILTTRIAWKELNSPVKLNKKGDM